MKFIANRKIWFSISLVCIAISIAALGYNFIVHGRIMNFGIDFTGGAILNLRFENPQSVNTGSVREILTNYKLSGAAIQKTQEGDIFIRSEPIDYETRVKIIEDLGQKFGKVELLEADMIGPIIGKELQSQAIWALIIASIGILIYTSFRFEYIFGAAALIALLHDAIIATGFMALFWRNIDIPFVAGILTILGYSINDTIVIFDRIRENLKKLPKKNFEDIIDLSISQTMARSINTVLTVIVMVLCLLFFGGATLRDFCLVLLVGFVSGAYSSIFVASPLLYLMQKFQNRK